MTVQKATTKRRNTFSKMGGTTYPCAVCGRRTRHTGVQSLGSETCPQCFDLAGIENEISDGHRTQADAQADIDALLAEIVAKGGDVSEWAALSAAPAAAPASGGQERVMRCTVCGHESTYRHYPSDVLRSRFFTSCDCNGRENEHVDAGAK